MSSSWFGLTSASTALNNFQHAIQVTGNNIANVNTPGYSRQVVNFMDLAGSPIYSNGRQWVGQGVTIGSITQVRDQFLDSQMRDTLSSGSKSGTLAGGLQGVLQAMNEPGDSGISNALDSFFNAWSSLSSNPNQNANLVQVQLAGSTLATRIRSTYADLSNQQADANNQINTTIDQINQLSKNISTLNNQIRAAKVGGGSPNDLMDQRNSAVESLSKLVNLKQVDNADGTISLHVNQFTIVDTITSNALPKTPNNANSTLTDASGMKIDITGGSLAGLMGSASNISSSMANLDQLANTLRTQVNTMHQTGTNANGTTGINFFGDVPVTVPPTPQTGAIDFDLSTEVKADVRNISAGVSGKPGDGGLALSLAGLRSSQISGLGNKSITDFYGDMVTTLGSSNAYYTQAQKTQDLLGQQTDAQRQSVSGVSLDEEMQNMLKFQQGYQAAAKMVTMADQMLQTVIDMVR